MLGARFCRRPQERQRRLINNRRPCSCGTPDRSRRSELRSHAAAGFSHLFRGEASLLLFPQPDRCQTSPSLKRFASRGGQYPSEIRIPRSGRTRWPDEPEASQSRSDSPFPIVITFERSRRRSRQGVLIEHPQGCAPHRVVIPGSGASSELAKQLTDLA